MKLDRTHIPKIAFWSLMVLAQALAFLLFKDLADISQWVVQGARETTMAVWYNRYPLAAASAVLLVAASVVWLKTRAGIGKKGFIALLLVFCAFWYSGMVNPHIMMRPRQADSVWVNVEEATKYVGNDESVIVYEIDGVARAHPDLQVLRPHVAGAAPVNDTEVVMTYCGLTNLGMAYVPEIDGQKLDLAPMTQLENNLVMYDRNSGEPIQQLWGRTEADVVAGRDRGMREYPTFRMPFGKFAEAYPDGEVFVNDYLVEDMRPGFWQNPPLFVYDRAMELIFNGAIHWQKNYDSPVFPTIDHYDPRLPNKAKVWGFDINHDYVAYTEEFVRENGNLVNAKVGGQDVVIAWDEQYQSLGVWFNHTGAEIASIDFWGMADAGQRLTRVETTKAGAFWVVWANFFPTTDVNRV